MTKRSRKKRQMMLKSKPSYKILTLKMLIHPREWILLRRENLTESDILQIAKAGAMHSIDRTLTGIKGTIDY